jgi:hypothetical protein
MDRKITTYFDSSNKNFHFFFSTSPTSFRLERSGMEKSPAFEL